MSDAFDDHSENGPDGLGKEVESELQEHGPLSYKELVNRLNVSIDALKSTIERLRDDDVVVNTLEDERYEISIGLHDRNVAYWDVKVYDDGKERETIRGLTTTVKDTLLQVFDRNGVAAKALPYTKTGEFIDGKTETVNKHTDTGIEK
jgi:DNA-binding Lrp family transcriptional regulator